MLAYNRGHFVDTLSSADAGDRRGARFGWKVPALATTGNWKQIKNNTIEASMFLRTHRCTSRTNLKRTQIECTMCVSNAQFESFHSAQVLSGSWSGEIASASGIARLAENRRGARNYKNSGNEAKNSLKTNEITFFSAANYAQLTRRFTPIERWMEQDGRNLSNT